MDKLETEVVAKSLVTPEVIAHYKKFEGYANHFYLDGPGFVTIGIGCMIPNANAASKLRMINEIIDRPATPDEIIEEYDYVKTSLSGQTLKYYEEFTSLTLPEKDIISLFDLRYRDKFHDLKRMIPEFLEFPDAVQEVLLDMAFNLGVTGLLMKFPNFITKIRAHKYSEAALNCHRRGIGEERNLWAKNMLLSVGTI